MLRLKDGGYICHLNGHQISIRYLGNNVCEIYLENELQGRAPFDYVKKKLNLFEKRWDSSKITTYKYKNLQPTFDPYKKPIL